MKHLYKTIIPFCTSAGRYMTGKESRIADHAKGATVLNKGLGLPGRLSQDEPKTVKDEQEIAGYRDALAQVHTEYMNINFSEADILRLHAIMLNFAGYSYGGTYKDSDNAIVEIDGYGQRRIRFSPTPAAGNLCHAHVPVPPAADRLNMADMIIVGQTLGV